MKITRRAIVELLTALGRIDAQEWATFTLASRINGDGIMFYMPNPLPKLSTENGNLLAEIIEMQSKGELIEIDDDPATNTALDKALDSILQPGFGATTTDAVPDSVGGSVKEDTPKPRRKRVRQRAATPKTQRRDKAKPKEPKRREKPKESKRRKAEPKVKKPAKKVKPVTSATWRSTLRSWKRSPMPITDRGAGVTRFVVEQLSMAGQKDRPIAKQSLWRRLCRKFPNRSGRSLMYTLSNLLGSRLARQYGIKVQKTPGWSEGNPRRYWIASEQAKAS